MVRWAYLTGALLSVWPAWRSRRRRRARRPGLKGARIGARKWRGGESVIDSVIKATSPTAGIPEALLRASWHRMGGCERIKSSVTIRWRHRGMPCSPGEAELARGDRGARLYITADPRDYPRSNPPEKVLDCQGVVETRYFQCVCSECKCASKAGEAEIELRKTTYQGQRCTSLQPCRRPRITALRLRRCNG